MKKNSTSSSSVLVLPAWPCALKAGRAGLRVLMLEKMSVVGGNSAICGGNVACPCNPVQKAQGIKDSKELFIEDCLRDGLGINHTNLLGHDR